MIKTGFLTFCGIVLGTLLAGCGEQAQVESTAPADPAAPTAPEPVLFTDDLDAMTRRGELRILVERQREDYLPRKGDPLRFEQESAAAFARKFGLRAELVHVEEFPDLLPALLEGRGDVAAACAVRTLARTETCMPM